VDDKWKGSSAKLEVLMEQLEQLKEQGNRPLIFSQFTSHLALIREALEKAGFSYQYLDGQTTPAQRQERVEAFQRGESDVFLISLKAGGTGLNLTAADYVIHMDPWWNPAVEDQATDRAQRIGQTKPVMVYRIIARGTIEEQILQMHDEKRDLVDGVLSGADAAGKLSTKELADMIRQGIEVPGRR
jgi:SNF2 family DNA or RNA helicase